MDASTIRMIFFIIPLLLKFDVPELGITKSNASGISGGISGCISGCISSCISGCIVGGGRSSC